MPALAPFTPAGTVSLAVTTSTARVALSAPRGDQIRIANPAGGQIVFLRFGDSTVNAALTDTPILTGAVEVFTIPRAATHMAAIAGGLTTVFATVGDGQ